MGDLWEMVVLHAMEEAMRGRGRRRVDRPEAEGVVKGQAARDEGGETRAERTTRMARERKRMQRLRETMGEAKGARALREDGGVQASTPRGPVVKVEGGRKSQGVRPFVPSVRGLTKRMVAVEGAPDGVDGKEQAGALRAETKKEKMRRFERERKQRWRVAKREAAEALAREVEAARPRGAQKEENTETKEERKRRTARERKRLQRQREAARKAEAKAREDANKAAREATKMAKKERGKGGKGKGGKGRAQEDSLADAILGGRPKRQRRAENMPGTSTITPNSSDTEE